MDSSSIVPSSIKALNAGISSHNPFVNAGTVHEPEIWIDRQADSTQLNLGARSRLHTAYGRICRGETVAAVTLLGQTGTGKTHELNRLRQHVHTAPTPGLFVYLNVQQFAEGQAVRQQFLRAIGDSFVRRTPSGLLQWQQLAIALANHALSGLDNSRKQFAPRSVLELLSRNSLEQNQAWIDRIAEAFFRVRPDIDDPDIVRAIFWTLCPHQLPYARKWLSGLMLPSWKRNELGLPQPRMQNPESQAWQTTLNLLAAIEHYAPVTIAFDCFEHPEIPEPGVQKERVAIGLIKWLGDRLRTRTRRFGVLFVSAMHPDTWDLVEEHFGPVAQFAHDRSEPCGLQPADAETIEQAIECWLKTFYQARNLVPPTPLYPFDRAQVAALVRESVDLHDAIEWCADNFQPVETDPLESVELRFGEILRELADDGLGDDWTISQAIAQAFSQLKGCDLTIDDPINPADRDESMIAEISEISFRVHDVVSQPKSRTFPVTIELEILDIATPEIALVTNPEPDISDVSDVSDVSGSSNSPASETIGTASQPSSAHILHIGLGALTSENGRQLCAQIDRCAEAIQAGPGATGESSPVNPAWILGCLVRPLGATIPAHWKAAQSYDQFAQHDRGLVIEFSLDDIAPLLALMRLDTEIGDREQATAAARSSIPIDPPSSTANDMDSKATNPQSLDGLAVDQKLNFSALEQNQPEEERSEVSTDRAAQADGSDSAEPTIGAAYELELGLESPHSDRSTSTDPAHQDAAMNQANQAANDAANEAENGDEPELEHEVEPIADADHASPEPNDFAALPIAFSNNRLSRFPSAKPVRDLVITRKLLAAWIDRENIAIDNVIVCTLIGRAVTDLVRRGHPMLNGSRQVDSSS
jgi:hypothetical protein